MHQEPGPALDPDAMCRVGRLLLGADRMAPKLHAGLLLRAVSLKGIASNARGDAVGPVRHPPLRAGHDMVAHDRFGAGLHPAVLAGVMVPLGYVTADPGRRTTDTIERVVESSGSRRSGRGGSRTRKAPGTARRVVAPALQAGPVSGRVALPYPQFQWAMQGPNLGGNPSGVAPACHAGAGRLS